MGGASRKQPYAFSKKIPACLLHRRVERETRAGASTKKDRLVDSTLISLNARLCGGNMGAVVGTLTMQTRQRQPSRGMFTNGRLSDFYSDK